MGVQALRYASTTLDLGLEFRKVEGPSFGEEGQLSHSRSSNALEVYADASHSPNGERSRQCVIVAWKGSILLWEATRQSFTTLSTAESELIALIHASQVGECVGPIVEELVGEDVVTSLLGDNSASLASFDKGAGSWRNRHLRMRAGAGREKVAAGVLFPSHVPGHLQVADIGTKPLPAHKLLGLLAIVNVRMPLDVQIPPTAAKFFARIGRLSPEAATAVSPALILVLALLTQSQVAESRRLLPVGFVAWAASEGTTAAQGQPTETFIIRWDIWWAILSGLIGFAAFVLGMGILGFDHRESKEGSVSPRHRRESASSSWQGGSVQLEREPPLQEDEAETPSEQVYRGIFTCGPNGESSQFPIVGRMDYRSHWVPMHYFRGLLSLVGGLVFQYLDVDGVEVWYLRALGCTFRYGVAVAYECAQGARLRQVQGVEFPVYDIAQAQVRAAPEAEEEDDLAIDQVRHVDPQEEWGPWPQEVDLGLELGSDGSSDLSSSSDGTLLASTGVPVSSGPSGEVDEEIGGAPPEVGPPEQGVGGVSYRAVDGALLVIYRGQELRVELPNWSFEEVHSIVVSIQRGDWSPFHEVVSWGSSQLEWTVGPRSSQNRGIPPGEIAIGQVNPESEVEPLDASGHSGRDLYSEEREASEDRWPSVGVGTLRLLEGNPPDSVGTSWWVQALDQVGWLGWMFSSSCFVVGVGCLCWLIWSFLKGVVILEAIGRGSPAPRVDAGVALLTVWVLSVLHRGGVVLRRLKGDPLSVSFERGSRPRGATVELRGDGRLWIWLCLVILFGLAEPNEARGGSRLDDEQGQVAVSITSVLVSPVDGVCAEGSTLEGSFKGGYAWEAVKICSAVALWEILKTVRRRMLKPKKSALSQTSGDNFVPLPLPGGVPNRPEILFCLWKSGFEISVESYPVEVQDQFHAQVGGYLMCQDRDEELSD